jgi:hypothetical protein
MNDFITFIIFAPMIIFMWACMGFLLYGLYQMATGKLK